MIKTAAQLKAKVRNVSQGDSLKAQTLIRNYFMIPLCKSNGTIMWKTPRL